MNIIKLTTQSVLLAISFILFSCGSSSTNEVNTGNINSDKFEGKYRLLEVDGVKYHAKFELNFDDKGIKTITQTINETTVETEKYQLIQDSILVSISDVKTDTSIIRKVGNDFSTIQMKVKVLNKEYVHKYEKISK